MDELATLAAKPIAFMGFAILFVGMIYLGIQLKDGSRGGGELVKALALITSGMVIVGFAAAYGFHAF